MKAAGHLSHRAESLTNTALENGGAVALETGDEPV
jgi:hypothetical protein